MALFRPTYVDKKTRDRKISKIWWYEFVYAGKRVRESAKTTRKTVATEAEKKRRLDLERAMAGLPVEAPEIRIRTVSESLKQYATSYAVNHRKKSVQVVKERSPHLVRILGSLLPGDLTDERIIDYMVRRQGEGASSRTINMELSVLSRALGRTWKALWPKVKKLEENKDVGRALERDEEAAILKAAGKGRAIHTFIQVLTWTGMRSDEARTLRWGQVDFDSNHIVVGKSKTTAGTGRVIPMSATLRATLEDHSPKSPRPDHYVFPCKSGDPTTPVTSFKRGWEAVRNVAGVECRLHDFRHTFCTKLAEAGVPESTMLDMMGHVSAAMLRRYSHIRAQARRDAIAAVEATNGVPQVSPKAVQSKVRK